MNEAGRTAPTSRSLTADLAFVYLVVDNGNDQYIEPPGTLGAGVDGPFYGYCYLGFRDDPGSLNQEYVVFAVVSNKEYEEYDLLDGTSILARSNDIQMRRTH